MSIAQRIRKALAGPAVDADGWFMREVPDTEPAPGPAPEFDPLWCNEPDLDAHCAELDRQRRNERLGMARPCARWRHGAEHEDHVWDDDGAVAQCPGWRGEP